MTLATASDQNNHRQMSQDAREAMISENVDLVNYIVGRVAVHLPDGVDRDDLISAGLIGLIKAVDRYDPSRGNKFRTYASTVVRGEIMESLRARDWAPRSVRRRARELEETVRELSSRLGRSPTDNEIADALELSIDDYYDLLSLTSRTNIASLQDLFDHKETQGSETPPVPDPDSSSDPARVMQEEAVLEVVAEEVERLPERDRQVIGLYYDEELTMKEIGHILDVTESRVCQIHTQAIVRLRASVRRRLSA